MSKIRGKNTKAEMEVFKYLRKRKIYFQKHYKRGLGKPDVALPRKKKVVFVDGDFWHGRTIDRVIEREIGNPEYWIPKLKRNMERDLEINQHYADKGWQVLRVWESDIMRKRDREEVMNKIERFLNE